MNLHAIAQEIESESERLCIEKLGHTPHTWYTGGSQHNDDRLRASVVDGEIIVTDGNASDRYHGDMDGVPDYVSDWLDAIWGAE